MWRAAELAHVPHPKYLPPDLTASDLLDLDAYSTQAGYRTDLQLGYITYLLQVMIQTQSDFDPCWDECFVYQTFPEDDGKAVHESALAFMASLP